MIISGIGILSIVSIRLVASMILLRIGCIVLLTLEVSIV